MNLAKLNRNTLTQAGAFSVGAVGGAMASRVLADKIPLQNTKIKRGILFALGVAVAALADSKQTAGKVVQGVGVGMASTQAVDLLKEFINPSEGLFKTALGSPVQEFIYVNSPEPPAYADYQEVAPTFLSGVEDDSFAVV